MVALPTDHVDRPEEFVTGAAVAEMSRHAERCGLDAVFVTDHPAPDDRWLAGGGHHALEPTVALSFAAAATTTLRVVTNIYVLAYRAPLLAAKTLATLDALSGGRLTVGVAAGYLRPEFRALGADFEHRGERLDEAIAVLRSAWTGSSYAGEGPGWSARGTTILPLPAQPGGPPIWCGGNSRAAMTRAVTGADGWLPFATPAGMSGAVRTAEIATLDDLAARLDLLDRLCEEHGRAERPTICFTPISTWAEPERLLDEVGRLGELGVDWVSVTIPDDGTGTRASWMDAVSALSSALGSPTR
ncbi:MAG: TIGR03619 family F420-dependent LLM class oxidoreductase [Acidimicrobiales bacterium]